MSNPRRKQELADPFERQWKTLLHFLPPGGQDVARTGGAITRLRAVQSEEALLRMTLAYAWNDWSSRTTAAWAKRIGLAERSDVAILNRLRHANTWLGQIMDAWFRGPCVTNQIKSRFRLVLTDGSTLQEPGSTGTTWRLHGQWDLATRQWEYMEVPDKHGPESFTRLHLRPKDVVLGDGNEARASAATSAG